MLPCVCCEYSCCVIQSQMKQALTVIRCLTDILYIESIVLSPLSHLHTLVSLYTACYRLVNDTNMTPGFSLSINTYFILVSLYFRSLDTSCLVSLHFSGHHLTTEGKHIFSLLVNKIANFSSWIFKIYFDLNYTLPQALGCCLLHFLPTRPSWTIYV